MELLKYMREFKTEVTLKKMVNSLDLSFGEDDRKNQSEEQNSWFVRDMLKVMLNKFIDHIE